MARKKSISATAFKVRYLKRSRELYKRYLEAKPWLKQLYVRLLELKPEMRVVDVGCGTGDFARRLARLVPGKCRVIGVDNRAASLRTAASEDRKAGLSGKISYRKGDAFALPVQDGFADLTTCRTLLIHLTEPERAVREMARVTKPGGLVAAVEPGDMRSMYDPEDERYVELAKKLGRAYFKGIMKLEGKDMRLGEKLPTIFRKAGLVEVAAEIQADSWMPSDPRYKLEDVKAEVQFEHSVYKDTKKIDRRYMLAGGARSSEVSELQRRYEARVKSLLADDDKLRGSTVLYGSSLFLVVGRKPRPNS
jgi:ubiquinone/menaquinone biosynthesis C-methylase UbiE